MPNRDLKRRCWPKANREALNSKRRCWLSGRPARAAPLATVCGRRATIPLCCYYYYYYDYDYDYYYYY